MTDETGLPGTGSTDPLGPTPSEAWNDVVGRLSDLGDAVVRWVKAAADEPDTKAKLDQVRAGIDEIGKRADAALGRAVRSDIGHQVVEGAEQAGQAIRGVAQQVSHAAAPAVRSTLAGLSDAFGKAAAKVDEATQRRAEPAPTVEPKPSEEERPADPGDE
jgi:hypothetical protein